MGTVLATVLGSRPEHSRPRLGVQDEGDGRNLTAKPPDQQPRENRTSSDATNPSRVPLRTLDPGTYVPPGAPTRPPQGSRHPQGHGSGSDTGRWEGRVVVHVLRAKTRTTEAVATASDSMEGLPVACPCPGISPEHEAGEGDAPERSVTAATRRSTDVSSSPGPRTERGPPRYGKTDVRRWPTYSRRFSRTICSKLAGVGGQPSVM